MILIKQHCARSELLSAAGLNKNWSKQRSRNITLLTCMLHYQQTGRDWSAVLQNQWHEIIDISIPLCEWSSLSMSACSPDRLLCFCSSGAHDLEQHKILARTHPYVLEREQLALSSGSGFAIALMSLPCSGLLVCKNPTQGKLSSTGIHFELMHGCEHL